MLHFQAGEKAYGIKILAIPMTILTILTTLTLLTIGIIMLLLTT